MIVWYIYIYDVMQDLCIFMSSTASPNTANQPLPCALARALALERRYTKIMKMSAAALKKLVWT